MGWRELSVTYDEKTSWMNQLRLWMLAVVVSWMAGWGLADMALKAGDVQVAATAGEGVIQG
ncbi:MAG: hypothetical protein WAZ18_02020 [Alphaproteobacteria bacterium]